MLNVDMCCMSCYRDQVFKCWM